MCTMAQWLDWLWEAKLLRSHHGKSKLQTVPGRSREELRTWELRELRHPVFRMSVPAYLHFLPSCWEGKDEKVMAIWVGMVGMLLAGLSLSYSVVMD